MNPEDRRLLERAVELSEENNKILHSIRRANRLGMIWKIIYWVAIIAISYGAYIYIQPYVDQLMTTYNGLVGTAASAQKTVSQFSGLDKLLNVLPK